MLSRVSWKRNEFPLIGGIYRGAIGVLVGFLTALIPLSFEMPLFMFAHIHSASSHMLATLCFGTFTVAGAMISLRMKYCVNGAEQRFYKMAEPILQGTWAGFFATGLMFTIPASILVANKIAVPEFLSSIYLPLAFFCSGLSAVAGARFSFRHMYQEYSLGRSALRSAS
jgi:hypothetical protein